MGSPELPPADHEERGDLQAPIGALDMNPQNSDESDMEEDQGYAPLALDSETEMQSDEEEVEETAEEQGINGFPSVLSVNAEVNGEVWNAQRPAEHDIVLDSTKTQEILAVMSNFRLRPEAIPPWARDISEEAWNTTVQERVRTWNTSKESK